MSEMIEPNFIVIGAGKAGTSFLYEMLMAHPDVLWSTPKELNFFSLDHNYDKGWEWYCRHFEGASGTVLVGEGSPSYTAVYEKTPERMAHHIPNAKLIYTVRHPIERIRSGYMQFQHHCGYHRIQVPNDINVAVRKIPRLIAGSRYWHWIQAYRRYFQEDQIHVIFAEDMRANPGEVLNGCFEFLGVDPKKLKAETSKRVNPWENLQKDRLILRLARYVPGFQLLSHAAPTSMKSLLNTFMRTRQNARPVFDEETIGWLLDQLKDDACRLLEFYGKPSDFWDL